MNEILLVGLGQPSRHDDGAGLEVVRLCDREAHDGVRVVAHEGDAADLIDLWDGVDLAVVVDASRSGEAAGTVLIFMDGALETMPTLPGGSTHALGLREAIALAEALGRLPRALVVVTIEGEDFSMGKGLSPAVQLSAHRVASWLGWRLPRLAATRTQGKACA